MEIEHLPGHIPSPLAANETGELPPASRGRIPAKVDTAGYSSGYDDTDGIGRESPWLRRFRHGVASRLPPPARRDPPPRDPPRDAAGGALAQPSRSKARDWRPVNTRARSQCGIIRRRCPRFHRKVLREDPRPRPRLDAVGTLSRSRIPNAGARRRVAAASLASLARGVGRTGDAIRNPLALMSRLPRRFRRGRGAPSPTRPSLGARLRPRTRRRSERRRRHRRGADKRGSCAPPRLSCSSVRINTTLASPSSRLVESISRPTPPTS